MVDLYITIIFACPAKKRGFSAGPRSSACSGSFTPRCLRRHEVGADQFAWIELNQRQQKTTKINNSGWGGSGPDTTNINRNQQKSTESAKASKSQAKSSPVPGAVSKSQHFLLRFVNRVQCSSEPTALLEHKGVCHRWAGNELQIPLAK